VGAAGEFEELNAAVEVGAVGAPVLLDGLLQVLDLGSPLARLPLVEGLADLAVEFVDVHLVEPVLDLGVLDLEASDGLVVEPLLVLVTVAQRLRHEFENLGVDRQPPEQLRELVLQDLLAGVRLRAAALVAGAPVVGVAALVSSPVIEQPQWPQMTSPEKVKR
jgi:hypothetical protein